MTRVGVVLSGCGIYDGAEILFMAPDVEQMHVVNHVDGQPAEGESRNVLVESARIARGSIDKLVKKVLELV